MTLVEAGLLLFYAAYGKGCASTGSLRNSEIITDPTFSFTISPPVRWTYYPPVMPAAGQQINNFFPGQSITSADALQAAQNEVMASYLEALSQIPIPTNDVTATVTYSPDPISNCYMGVIIPAGTMVGLLSGGAISEVALVSGTGGQGATATNCPLSTTTPVVGIGPYMEYQKTVTVSTRGTTTLSRFTWERVISQFQSIMNFRYQVLFRTPAVIQN